MTATKVFAQLGFDTFTPIEYMYDIERNPTGWCKDKVLVGEIEKVLDSSIGSVLIYTISVQGAWENIRLLSITVSRSMRWMNLWDS